MLKHRIVKDASPDLLQATINTISIQIQSINQTGHSKPNHRDSSNEQAQVSMSSSDWVCVILYISIFTDNPMSLHFLKTFRSWIQRFCKNV
jgi:hypothetical protein